MTSDAFVPMEVVGVRRALAWLALALCATITTLWIYSLATIHTHYFSTNRYENVTSLSIGYGEIVYLGRLFSFERYSIEYSLFRPCLGMLVFFFLLRTPNVLRRIATPTCIFFLAVAAHICLFASPSIGGGLLTLIFDALLAPSTVIFLARETKRQFAIVRHARGLCIRCGYDLRGTPERCPECGAARTTIVL